MRYHEELEAKDLAIAESKKNNREIYDYELIDKKNIIPGDTIIWEGVTATVSRKNLKRNSFTGLTIFGDSCMLGLRKIVKIIYKNWKQ